MSTKHTPGPWKVVDREILEDGSVYPRHIIGGVTELQVCFMECQSAAHAYVYDEAWKEFGQSEMQQANARLIAAAPETAAERDKLKEINVELLEALEVAKKFCEQRGGSWADFEEIVRAAIAKATRRK